MIGPGPIGQAGQCWVVNNRAWIHGLVGGRSPLIRFLSGEFAGWPFQIYT